MKIKRYRQRTEALRLERSTFDPHYRDLGEFFLPRRTRFATSDRNRGNRKNDKIYNETPITAARTTSSGIMAGMTSPARPWFRLQMTDPELMRFHSVAVWLSRCEQRVRDVFLRSNFYSCIHEIYGDLAVFGTGAMFIEDDPEDIIRCTVLPLGAYWLADDAGGRISTVYRQVRMTAEQMVERFGRGNVSDSVGKAYDKGNYDQAFDVWHVVEPNHAMQPGKLDSSGMPYHSCWFEDSASDQQQPLRSSGYRERPFMCPRWTVRSEDIYGSSPAMDALGAARQLQVLEKRYGQMLEKGVNPPMHGPRSAAQSQASTQPGAFTFYDDAGGQHRFEPSHVVDARFVQKLGEDIMRTEGRISDTMYATLFLLLTATGRPNMTAREVEERHEEKLLQIGPVIDRMQDELLDPAVYRTFAILQRTGTLPPPPREVQGAEWRVEYISILAQAQKLLGTLSLEKLSTFAAQNAQVAPESIDQIDMDKLNVAYADALGAPPEVLRSEQAVEELREQRRAEAALQAEAVAKQAQAVKDLSEARPPGPDNALGMLSQAYGGQNLMPPQA